MGTRARSVKRLPITAVIARRFLSFTVAQPEHVEHRADAGAQRADLGRVAHAERRQRSAGRRTVRRRVGRVHRDGRVAVPRVPGSRRVGSLRLSESRGVRAAFASRQLPEERRDRLEHREIV